MQPHHRLYPDQPAVYCLASRDIDPSSVRTGSLGPPRDRHTESFSSRRRLPTEPPSNPRDASNPLFSLSLQWDACSEKLSFLTAQYEVIVHKKTSISVTYRRIFIRIILLNFYDCFFRAGVRACL